MSEMLKHLLIRVVVENIGSFTNWIESYWIFAKFNVMKSVGRRHIGNEG